MLRAGHPGTTAELRRALHALQEPAIDAVLNSVGHGTCVEDAVYNLQAALSSPTLKGGIPNLLSQMHQPATVPRPLASGHTVAAGSLASSGAWQTCRGPTLHLGKLCQDQHQFFFGVVAGAGGTPVSSVGCTDARE